MADVEVKYIVGLDPVAACQEAEKAPDFPDKIDAACLMMRGHNLGAIAFVLGTDCETESAFRALASIMLAGFIAKQEGLVSHVPTAEA